MSPTKPANKDRDLGLTIHRLLQWVASIGVTVVGAIVVSGMGTWGKLKEQAIRMENVPTTVNKISENMERFATFSAVQVTINEQTGHRLDALESKRR